MSKTGGAELLASALTGALHWAPESSRLMVMLALVYLFTNMLTEFLSNNAVAALVTPVVITAAIADGAEPRPFIIAVAPTIPISRAWQLHRNTVNRGYANWRTWCCLCRPLRQHSESHGRWF